MAREERDIWLVTHNGAPVAWRWALVARPEEVDESDPRVQGHAAGWNRSALTPAEAADPAYDATPSRWRRVPLLAQAGVVDDGARMEGRAVVANGVKFRLDDRGRPSGRGEPHEPDPEIVDESALISAAERIGQPIEVTERGTGRRLRVLHERPQGARDSDLSKPGVRVLARAQDGKSIARIEAAT